MGNNESLSRDEKVDLQSMLATSLKSNRHIPIHMDLVDVDSESLETDDGYGQIGVKKIEDAVREMARGHDQEAINGGSKIKIEGRTGGDELPRTITFPYSRHSSYPEQCDLLDKLRPRDVWPCTVNQDKWFCSGTFFFVVR